MARSQSFAPQTSKKERKAEQEANRDWERRTLAAHVAPKSWEMARKNSMKARHNLDRKRKRSANHKDLTKEAQKNKRNMLKKRRLEAAAAAEDGEEKDEEEEDENEEEDEREEGGLGGGMGDMLGALEEGIEGGGEDDDIVEMGKGVWEAEVVLRLKNA